MRIERDDPGPITRPRGTDDTGPPSGSTHSEGDSPELELLGRIAAAVRGAHDAGVPFQETGADDWVAGTCEPTSVAFRVVVVAGLVGALAMVPLGLALTATGFEVNGRPFPWIARA